MLNPPRDATALAEPVSVELSDLEQATVSFEIERSRSDLSIYAIAASKLSESTYRVKFDGSEKWGPARIPPTDLDVQAPVWIPPETVDQSITVEITNLRSDGTTREYHILPLGWES